MASDISTQISGGNSREDISLSGNNQQHMWSNMSRLVHDLRQPLSVIEICAEYLDLILPEGEQQIREQVKLLKQQIDDASRMLCEASGLLTVGYRAEERVAAPVSRSATKAESVAAAY
ncbi:MAG: hypothetical protein U0Q18_27970 [Bryobacteraceae bacterium]